MSFVTASDGSARSSSHVQLTGSAPPSIANVHSSSRVCGVGPADSTGKSSVTYWPGGRRPLSSPRPRPLKPRETMPTPSVSHEVCELVSRRPGQAGGPPTRRFRTPCWPTAPAEAGPQGFGASRGGCTSRLPPKGHAQRLAARAADDLELDLVARLLRCDQVDQTLDRRDRLTVDCNYHVTAGRPALTLDGDLVRRRLQTGVRCARSVAHTGDEHAAFDRK